jgi:hypothetical protein
VEVSGKLHAVAVPTAQKEFMVCTGRDTCLAPRWSGRGAKRRISFPTENPWKSIPYFTVFLTDKIYLGIDFTSGMLNKVNAKVESKLDNTRSHNFLIFKK